jgi:hypothetical protein
MGNVFGYLRVDCDRSRAGSIGHAFVHGDGGRLVREFAGDVGALRGTAANLAGAVGTAAAGALLIGLLSANVMRDLTDNPIIPQDLKQQVGLDNITFVITFVSNDRLLDFPGRQTTEHRWDASF